MYVWIWRHLPGPLLLRLLQSVVLLAIAVTVLFVWVFPRVESALPYSDVTVPAGPSSGPSGTPSAGPTGSPAPPATGPATLPAD